ncbi:N-acetylmuramoyl-L-alanine amidase LytC precursor [uncultured Eubacterium sp.]|jgi:N-acetylmuramoyl-L-alanine amidase|nr:N-acetylmuramoyl-L-alanine amidase [uncultured Anaerostipes sp.]SCI56504.1 N-acetylmuramoyl-L-alanine amidase LytC precursor [uncultured Eubacterium sp.]
MLKKKFICLGLSMTMLFASIINTPAAVTAGQYYKIKYTHNKKTVTKRAIDARYNNKVIKTNMPGYIEGSTSMYSAYWIFGRCSSINTKYSYSSKTNKINLTRGSQKLVLTLNSTTATINGKRITLPSAPRKVYYPARKKNYIMIPGDAVAKNLQLNYTWNNRLLSGLITQKGSTSAKPATTTASNTSTTSTTLGSKTKITASASNYSIRIKKPSGLSTSAVTCVDDYSNKRLRIIVNGNYKTFFSTSSNRYVKESLTYNVTYSGGKTYIDLKTSTIKGFSISQTSSYIYVKYADPKKMFYRVVVVDAGHGGSDSGAVGNGYYEKNMTLKIVQSIKSNFDKNSTYKVYYTRLSDWYPSLSYRYKMANEVSADRFLSVHINSSDSSSSKGTETLYKTYKSYAQTLQSSALTGMGYASNSSYNRGLKYRSDLAVLNGPKMTTSLVELGFISNKTEANRINSRTSTIGYNLYKAICNSF